MSERLTPYDTGERLEPHVWVKGEVATPGGLPRRVIRDDYGRVDFDNEEGSTILTALVERTADGSGYVLRVDNLSEPLAVEVVDQLGRVTRIAQPA